MPHTLHSRLISAVLIPATLAAISSCNISSTENANTENVNHHNVIASIDLMSEGRIDFVEEEPGCLVTIGTFSDVDFFSPYKDLNPVELYEAFKGDAPEKLKQAFHDAQTAAKNVCTSESVPDFPANPDPETAGVTKKAYTGTYFQAHYCVDQSYDFDACYPINTGDMTYVKNCAYMKAYVNTISDTQTVTFNTYYYNNGWVNASSYDVPKGILLTYAVAGARKYRMFEMQVSVNIGDCYNISIMGNYELD